MIDEAEILADIELAGKLRDSLTESPVSADAIFLAINFSRGKSTRAWKRKLSESPAPIWFEDALTLLQGRSLTIGQFIALAGKAPTSRELSYSVGRWLRASGREPYRCGGDRRFRI